MRCAWLALWMLCGCVTSTAVAVGPPQPRKPPSCVIAIAAEAREERSADYQRVGSVCVTTDSGFGVPEPVRDAIKHRGAVRDELFARACALGGEVVAVSGLCSVGRVSAVEFAVRRARPASAVGSR
jgi:hypothetical protein